jgi:ABC-type phosphate transport system substrate-binding protein
MRTPLLIALVSLVIQATSTAKAEETIILNGASQVSNLSEDELRDYYLGKKTHWPDGSKVVVIVLKDGQSHEGLMKKLGKSSSQFITGWKKLVFTGKGAMPEQVATEDEMVSIIAKTPGAIGYADNGKAKEGVKAIALK